MAFPELRDKRETEGVVNGRRLIWKWRTISSMFAMFVLLNVRFNSIKGEVDSVLIYKDIQSLLQ